MLPIFFRKGLADNQAFAGLYNQACGWLLSEGRLNRKAGAAFHFSPAAQQILLLYYLAGKPLSGGKKNTLFCRQCAGLRIRQSKREWAQKNGCKNRKS